MLAPDPDRRIGSIDEALELLAKPEKPEKPEKKRRDKGENKKKRDERRQKREEKRAAQDARHQEWRSRSTTRVPLFGRVFARLGLLLALVTVTLTLGVVVPALLAVLSLLFGQRLRDGARASASAARQAQAAIGRASARLSGRTPAEPPPRVRVTTDFDRVRSVTELEAQSLAMRAAEARENADAWLEEKLESEEQKYAEEQRRRGQMRKHAQPPPKRKHWGR